MPKPGPNSMDPLSRTHICRGNIVMCCFIRTRDHPQHLPKCQFHCLRPFPPFPPPNSWRIASESFYHSLPCWTHLHCLCDTIGPHRSSSVLSLSLSATTSTMVSTDIQDLCWPLCLIGGDSLMFMGEGPRQAISSFIDSMAMWSDSAPTFCLLPTLRR